MGFVVRNFVFGILYFVSSGLGFCLEICSLVFGVWNFGVWDIEFGVFGMGF